MIKFFKGNTINIEEKLNRRAIFFLTIVFILFASVSFVFISIVYLKHQNEPQVIKYEIEALNKTRNSQDYRNNFEEVYYINGNLVDSLQKINNQLNEKIIKIEQASNRIIESESQNSDFFKLMIALIGSVFAIVGFFGFKSINDTKDIAIQKIDVKIDKDIPEKLDNKISEILPKIALTEAKKQAKKSTNEFLAHNTPNAFKKIEETINQRFDNTFTDINASLDKIMNPNGYHVSQRPLFYNELEQQIDEVKKSIELLKESIYRDLLKREIIEQLKMDNERD